MGTTGLSGDFILQFKKSPDNVTNIVGIDRDSTRTNTNNLDYYFNLSNSGHSINIYNNYSSSNTSEFFYTWGEEDLFKIKYESSIGIVTFLINDIILYQYDTDPHITFYPAFNLYNTSFKIKDIEFIKLSEGRKVGSILENTIQINKDNASNYSNGDKIIVLPSESFQTLNNYHYKSYPNFDLLTDGTSNNGQIYKNTLKITDLGNGYINTDTLTIDSSGTKDTTFKQAFIGKWTYY